MYQIKIELLEMSDTLNRDNVGMLLEDGANFLLEDGTQFNLQTA